MSKCLVPLSEETVGLIVNLKISAGDSLDAVIHRALSAVVEVQPTLPKPETPLRKGHLVSLFGSEVQVRTIQDALATVLESLASLDTYFLPRLSLEQARTRRIVARAPEALYPGSPHLAKYARAIGEGWWMATNCSRRDVTRAVVRACDVAGVRHGSEVSIRFSE
jgi:hypothetical protein